MQPTGKASNLIWSPEGKPVSVHLNPELAGRLRPLPAGEGVRAPERGGVLLGYAKQVGEKWLIAVEDAVEVETRIESGESWRPSPRALDAALRRKWPDGTEVVGFWRTHSRPGLYLDEADFRLFRSSFASESQVALVVAPESGGFFFWENGDVFRAHPYERFELPPAPPQAAGAAVPPRRYAPAIPALRPHNAWFAVPVVAGVLLGLFWNPDPLQRRNRSVSVSELSNSDSADEPRAVFAPPPLPESDAAQPYVPPAEEGDLAVRSRTAPAAEQAPRERRRMLPPPPRITAAEPVLDTDAPQMAAVKAPPRAIIPHQEPRLVQAVMEPSKPSAVRRVVGSIPGLGFLKRRKNAGDEPDSYVPPKVVKQVRPNAPAGLTEDVPVKVRVMLDAAGKIERAELMTRKVEPAVARAAVEAARSWRFEPARMCEKPVASELVVQFKFPAAAAGGG